MHTWVERQNEIEFLVSLHGVAVRLRFSSRLRIARIDIFRRNDAPFDIDRALVARGWVMSEKHLDAPPNAFGVRYEHTTITKKNVNYTRELLLRHLKYNNETSAVDGMFKELAMNRAGLADLAEDMRATER